jgi:hypothetical protein
MPGRLDENVRRALAAQIGYDAPQRGDSRVDHGLRLGIADGSPDAAEPHQVQIRRRAGVPLSMISEPETATPRV